MAIPSVITTAAYVAVLTAWTAAVAWYYTRTPKEDRPAR